MDSSAFQAIVEETTMEAEDVSLMAPGCQAGTCFSAETDSTRTVAACNKHINRRIIAKAVACVAGDTVF